MTPASAIVLALAILTGSLLIGGRYESHASGPIVTVVDRLTGAVTVCSAKCERLPAR